MVDKNLKTLQQGQGHQTWYELADPKQSYNNANNAKFENLCLNSVCEKANNKIWKL